MTATETLTVEVPDIGDFTDVPIIEVHVSPGDAVAVEDPLVTLESDKATMDVPAPAAGKVVDVLVSLGDEVSEGTPLLRLEPTEAVEAPDATDAAQAEVSSSDPVTGAPPTPPSSETDGARVTVSDEPTSTQNSEPVYASPSVRRLARELGVDLSQVTGSGRKGRVTREDLEHPTTAPAQPASAPTPGLAPWPSLDFSKQGPTERVPRTRIQKIAAPNLARNWALIPHVTHHDEADITELEAWRKQLNAERDDVKVTMVSFLVAASVATLKEFPDFNSSLDGDELVLKRYYNIGFAADTPDGLVVPVIKQADQKGLLQIAAELTELSGKARGGKLGLGDITGSTFSISSLGGIGGTGFTPIVNAPEVAILGVTRSAMKPVWNGREFEPRLILPLSLSYDHRVIDGAAAARFVVYLARVLSDLRRVLL
ncbi:MAG TPA: dihydrolipoyllysine-residue acetyltransferase [Solirubrobacteraceae bacterium]|nr:dihydrolipoyllysine-residue acetyltransferase [Solirubrobacteraceae bacterium]